MYLCDVRCKARDRTIYLTVIDLGSGAATRLFAPTMKIRFWPRDTFLRMTRAREEEDTERDTQRDGERQRGTDRDRRTERERERENTLSRIDPRFEDGIRSF